MKEKVTVLIKFCASFLLLIFQFPKCCILIITCMSLFTVMSSISAGKTSTILSIPSILEIHLVLHTSISTRWLLLSNSSLILAMKHCCRFGELLKKLESLHATFVMVFTSAKEHVSTTQIIRR